MARSELDRAVRPSLLDRLTDLAPREPSDHTVTREESASAFRRSVQRDVESLLNSRRTIVPVPPGCNEVLRSVHEYGLNDTTGLAVGTPEGRSRLTDDIRESLLRFEPRLINVKVVLVETTQLKAQQVRFTIEATLRMDPSPEQIVFDTVLEVARGTYDIASTP
jgi:type VI secretion system protein ImpF